MAAWNLMLLPRKSDRAQIALACSTAYTNSFRTIPNRRSLGDTAIFDGS
jgi:hypothetical protein